MKHLSLLLFSFIISSISFSQAVQNIPSTAYMVFSADLGRITKSMSISEMDDYDFIQKLVREFSGSNQEKVSLNDLGINYRGKIAVYTGTHDAYEFVGTSVDLKDNALFISNEEIRREFTTEIKSKGYSETERSIGFIHKKTFTRVEFDWNKRYFRKITDSIFDANKWERPYSYYYDYEDAVEAPMLIEEAVEEVEAESYDETIEKEIVEEEEESMEEKYSRIMDSVKRAEKTRLKKDFFKTSTDGNGLLKSNENFKSTMSVASDGSMYLDPSKMNDYRDDIFRYNPMLGYVRQFSNNVWQSAHMNMTKEGMNIEWLTHGDEKVMQVTKSAMDKNFNEELIKYIPSYSQGVAAYNMNMLGAYEEIKKLYMPVLDKSEKPEYLLASAIWSTIDEIVDESAVAEVYGANMILSYNGMKEMTLVKTTYDYDEETFEYTDREEEYQDLIPIMTWAISTKKAYLLEKYMKAACAFADEEIAKHKGYYEIKKGPMGGTPFYVAVKESMIIVTNDKSLVQDHLNGYDKNIDKELMRSIKETKLVYANMDMEQMPNDMMTFSANNSDREFIEALKDKTGEIELKMAEVTDEYQKMTASFRYSKNYKNGMFYLLDVIDTLMD